MQFLRTAFWVAIAVALAFFCMANYVPVTVRLWGDLVMETKLPVLLIGAFLLGALPFWVMARATRWRLRRRLDSTERALVVATAAATPPPAPAFSDVPDTPDSLTPSSSLTGPA
ncbi:lipopolysaccharide assembly protein LapA domain-containing protein [Sphingobium sp. BYY-5]|uniref:lipopolysaccharide assembly protein LapA domain-containing protein n=1 Tax=Sphingobium sp. BYY-5 TaxID=2926400 RepID=UPI001FA7359F|nr:lipopolysaccharide assembly protein LapA domain-containing protein [Sphingobium sp. BYY-5]MCI4589910.1 lipopolysaccharide assembly protein LapA domain-containing protein [Sphingobium sp. BYY-5]